jgi:hypothetical protein
MNWADSFRAIFTNLAHHSYRSHAIRGMAPWRCPVSSIGGQFCHLEFPPAFAILNQNQGTIHMNTSADPGQDRAAHSPTANVGSRGGCAARRRHGSCRRKRVCGSTRADGPGRRTLSDNSRGRFVRHDLQKAHELSVELGTAVDNSRVNCRLESSWSGAERRK